MPIHLYYFRTVSNLYPEKSGGKENRQQHICILSISENYELHPTGIFGHQSHTHLKSNLILPPRKTFLKARLSQRITIALMTNMFTCLTAANMGKGCSVQLTFGGRIHTPAACLGLSTGQGWKGHSCTLPACRQQWTSRKTLPNFLPHNTH